MTIVIIVIEWHFCTVRQLGTSFLTVIPVTDYDILLTVIFKFQDYCIILTVIFKFQDYYIILTVIFKFQDYYITVADNDILLTVITLVD